MAGAARLRGCLGIGVKQWGHRCQQVTVPKPCFRKHMAQVASWSLSLPQGSAAPNFPWPWAAVETNSDVRPREENRKLGLEVGTSRSQWPR